MRLTADRARVAAINEGTIGQHGGRVLERAEIGDWEVALVGGVTPAPQLAIQHREKDFTRPDHQMARDPSKSMGWDAIDALERILETVKEWFRRRPENPYFLMASFSERKQRVYRQVLEREGFRVVPDPMPPLERVYPPEGSASAAG